MKLAIDYLEPMLEKKNDGQEMPTLVIATVEGISMISEKSCRTDAEKLWLQRD